MDEYNIWSEGFRAGYKAAYEEARQLTFKDHYEKLCDEIRESVLTEILNKIKENYNEA